MENRERYKRLIMFLASAFILTLQTGVFAYVWFKDYAFYGAIGEALWKRGNYVVIAQYALMLYFFYRIYGGFKVGYLRVFEVLYSQVLSVLCVNAITYLQLALIGRWKFTKFIEPILKMTGVDLVIVVAWVVFMRWIYTKIYPPRQMLLVYGDYSPQDLIQINTTSARRSISAKGWMRSKGGSMSIMQWYLEIFRHPSEISCSNIALKKISAATAFRRYRIL